MIEEDFTVVRDRIARLIQQQVIQHEQSLSHRERTLFRLIIRMNAFSRMMKVQRAMPKVIINLHLALVASALSDYAVALECDQ